MYPVHCILHLDTFKMHSGYNVSSISDTRHTGYIHDTCQIHIEYIEITHQDTYLDPYLRSFAAAPAAWMDGLLLSCLGSTLAGALGALGATAPLPPFCFLVGSSSGSSSIAHLLRRRGVGLRGHRGRWAVVILFFKWLLAHLVRQEALLVEVEPRSAPGCGSA